jgi:hypothetical protein
MRSLFVVVALLFATGAYAQTQVYPPPLSGLGTITATTSSQSINTANVTVSTNSGAFPSANLPRGYLRLKVLQSQAAAVTVCWLGGTCSALAGEVIAIGEAVTKSISWNIGTQPPTIISASGSVVVEVEW